MRDEPALRAPPPSADDLIRRGDVADWLAARGAAHEAAALLPRQSLPDRLRREGSAGTCKLLAEQILVGWGVPDCLKPAQAMSAREGQDPQGLGAKPASAVGETDAPNPSGETHDGR